MEILFYLKFSGKIFHFIIKLLLIKLISDILDILRIIIKILIYFMNLFFQNLFTKKI